MTFIYHCIFVTDKLKSVALYFNVRLVFFGIRVAKDKNDYRYCF